MATAEFAKIMIESGQTLFDYTEATDSGDHKVFTVAGKSVFSDKSGYELIVRPDGVVTGQNMLSPHATVNMVTVAAFTCYLAGSLISVAATTSTATRPAEDKANICSVTVTNAGVVEIVAGTDSTTTALVETRGVAGGPPYIPVGSIEIGQVRLTDDSDAVILESEIFQTIGTHVERFDYPTWQEYPIGDGDTATSTAKKNAHIEFDAEIGYEIHTGDAHKPVYVRGYVPIFSEISRSVDFVPAENSHSISSKQVYNGTVGSSSTSLGQASFTAMMDDGITDSLIANRDQILVFKFFPNRNKTPYSLTQGKLGIKSTFPAADQIQASATISAASQTVLFSS